jgi:hypothetical protein
MTTVLICEGKASYPTMQIAQRVAARQSKDGFGKLEAYRCKFCNRVHVGHPRNLVKKLKWKGKRR